MTLHSAKGLEFPVVFLVGMEEGIFPGTRVMFAPPEEIEEERRLAYVGITRAKQKLFITNARRRMLFGNISSNNVSRFVSEIDTNCVKFESEPNPFAAASSFKPSQSSFSTSASNPFGRTSFGGSAKTNTFGNSSFGKPKPTAKFTVGDKVSHKVFGTGMIVKTTPMGNDTMLEISFDAVGTKKVMANFAKIEKI